jgi:hypothetical protein
MISTEPVKGISLTEQLLPHLTVLLVSVADSGLRERVGGNFVGDVGSRKSRAAHAKLLLDHVGKDVNVRTLDIDTLLSD